LGDALCVVTMADLATLRSKSMSTNLIAGFTAISRLASRTLDAYPDTAFRGGAADHPDGRPPARPRAGEGTIPSSRPAHLHRMGREIRVVSTTDGRSWRVPRTRSSVPRIIVPAAASDPRTA